MSRSITRRRAAAAALLAAPFAGAWRFALAYRARAGFPRRRPPVHDPSAIGLAFETVTVPSDDQALAAWWIPAAPGSGAASRAEPRSPAVVLVHGWESARDRTLPNAQLLHALGFHVLTIDVRGHGANPPERLPVTAGEFAADTLAAVRWALARRDVDGVAILGHSMGAAGALLAAAAEPRVAAVVAVSTPAGPYRLTRHTFRLARLPIPNALAYPLALVTTHVFVRPRRHSVRRISATRAAAAYEGPLLLVHGRRDDVIPVSHTIRLLRVARRARRRRAERGVAGSPGTPVGAWPPGTDSPVRLLLLPEGQHSWLYEFAAYRRGIGRFLAAALRPGIDALEAGEVAAAVPASRLPEPDAASTFSAIEATPGGLRTILRAIARGRSAG